jgi:hypothetical protein
MTTSIRRSKYKIFLNTGTHESPVWVLVGDGVAAGKTAYNPKVANETWISEENAEISVESYAPKLPIEMTIKSEDPAFEYIDNLRYGREVLSDTETEIVSVYLYEDIHLGFYPAELQPVSIQIDDFGGDGGGMAKISYTINFIGDATHGQFNPTPTAEFVAQPDLAVLATMVIGSVTLSPLFATDKKKLYYSGTVSNATTSVSMTSTCSAAGAVIVQKVGTDVVNQAGSAALSVGVNHLTIEVTVGTEVVTYHIDITRAAS